VVVHENCNGRPGDRRQVELDRLHSEGPARLTFNGATKLVEPADCGITSRWRKMLYNFRDRSHRAVHGDPAGGHEHYHVVIKSEQAQCRSQSIAFRDSRRLSASLEAAARDGVATCNASVSRALYTRGTRSTEKNNRREEKGGACGGPVWYEMSRL